MSKLSNLNVSFDAAGVKSMQDNAAAVMADKYVISDAVTRRLAWAASEVTFDDLVNAGKSGLREKHGVIRNAAGLFISGGMSGKMLGMPGISGYAGMNPGCIRRASLGYGICWQCFALKTPWKPSIKAWMRNDAILSTVRLNHGDLLLDPDLIPYMRYSSHGDVINALHMCNYLTAAADNAGTKFALWTKNADIVRAGFRMYGGPKPSNLTLIYSPLLMDCKPSKKALEAAKAAGFDAVFSVSKRRAGQDAAVNGGAHFCQCGPASCRGKCLFCYDNDRRTASGFDGSAAVLISEILDGERHKEK